MAIPLSLIPVNLKESALDSPTFRANVIHFCEQVDIVEKWLEGYIRSILKVVQELGGLEEALAATFSQSIPSSISESILDHDYSLLAIELLAEAGRDFWSIAIAYSKRMQPQMIEPLSEFLRNDIRQFKECKRVFEASQQRYDVLLQRYAGQSKGKEASALREDAFQLHESRKTYIRASFDFCVKAPELRAGLDRIITRVTTDLWREQVRYRKGFTLGVDRYESTMDRIRCWSDSMESSAKIFKQELALARKDMEEQARHITKPSRELDDYSSSTVPFLTTRGKESAAPTSRGSEAIEKQGWLFIRSATGKQGTRSIWVRRWCFVKDGIFGSLVLQGQGTKGSGVEETEKIGLLLCNVKPAFQEDRRFCFEIKTKDNSILLQAETQQELSTWLNVFEAAKQAAVLTSSGAAAAVSAFSISLPRAEFASAQMLRQDEIEKPTSLGISSSEQVSRVSADMGKRTPVAIDDMTSGSQTSRLGQILEIPSRKNTGSNPSQIGNDRKSMPGGGIQALISASHGVLPLNTVLQSTSNYTITSAPGLVSKGSNIPDGRTSLSLAPKTLVNLPMSTNLSKQALAASTTSDHTVTVPGGLMANSWGTSNWGLSSRYDEAINRQPDQSREKDNLAPSILPKSDTSGTAHSHRKAVSLDLDSQASSIPQAQHPSKHNYYPTNYPDELRQHDAQFRILFSGVPRDEIVLLVFRATWKPNDAQEFPGRAFVTSTAMYFYSHYLGLVLVNQIRLQFITEVQVTPGNTSDLIRLHLREVEELGSLSGEDISVTTFLEPIWVLQRRLRYLVNLTAMEKQTSLYEIMDNLTHMDNDPQQSPTSDSWEEISLGEGLEDVSSKSNPTSHGNRSMRQIVEQVTGIQAGSGQTQVLTTSPYTFVPPANTVNVFSQTFPISAKSLFCLLFGDRSKVFNLLYSKRRSSEILLSPWVVDGDNRGKRTLYYTNKHGSSLNDFQTIHALEENRYYTVFDEKYPWMIPSAKALTLVTTIVITQVSKSSSNISLWINIEWLKEPLMWRDAVGNLAWQILQEDAQDLASIISNEVHILGAGAKLFKIVSQYGQVTINGDSMNFAAPESVLYIPPSSAMLETTYNEFFVRYLTARVYNFTGTILHGLSVAFTGVFRSLRLNLILLGVLGISVLLNLVVSVSTAKEFWHSRAALSYVENVGVVPSSTMKRSITLQELELATQFNAPRFHAKNGQCFQKFLNAHAFADDMETGSQNQAAFSSKLELARRKLGMYRHDILVTLSLINSLEKSVLMSEWELWVWRERSRCRQARTALRNSTIFGDRTQNDKSVSIEAYCRSCDALVAIDRANKNNSG
ncbi:SNF1-interacting protein [Orbilia oligospora]|nr:SNF1-interacting protein [Orbilia oligospora]KAF3114025.1 SNF1-interacting protein [Orbilia oligospora]KAF3121735.1 SNF1-interacting protein [Orbilia oligospora]